MRSVLLLAVLAVPAAAQVSPTTVTLTMTDCSGAANSIAVDVYKPAGIAPFPTVGLGHGFNMDKTTLGGLAKNLAAAGILVVVPQFPKNTMTPCGGADHARNGRILLAALDLEVAAGLADANNMGIGGHSAGGLAAFLAASNRAFQAAVLLDGVDNSSLGQTAASKVTAPTFFLNAEPSACSSQNNSSTWYAPKPGAKARLKIINATHCDGEDPADPVLCFFCGAVNAARTAAFKTYASAFFRRYLLNQNMPCLETTAAGDTAVTSIDFQLGGCGADGGVGGGGGSTGGGTGATGGGSAATGGGTGATGGGSAATGGGTGGGSTATGGGSSATGGGSASTGGGSAATGGGTSSNGGGDATGGGSASGGGGTGGGTGCGCNSLPAGSLLGLLALVSRRRRAAL